MDMSKKCRIGPCTNHSLLGTDGLCASCFDVNNKNRIAIALESIAQFTKILSEKTVVPMQSFNYEYEPPKIEVKEVQKPILKDEEDEEMFIPKFDTSSEVTTTEQSTTIYQNILDTVNKLGEIEK